MTTQEQLEWRRSKVLELLATGMNQSQVAAHLQLPRQTISDDVKALRIEAKERIRNHLEDRLPLAFETCLTRIESSIRMAYEILNSTEDKRTKLQAIGIINDLTVKYMDLLTHTGTVEAAMSYAEKTNKQLSDISAAAAATPSAAKKDKANDKQENNGEVAAADNDTERFTEDNTRQDTEPDDTSDRTQEAVF